MVNIKEDDAFSLATLLNRTAIYHNGGVISNVFGSKKGRIQTE